MYNKKALSIKLFVIDFFKWSRRQGYLQGALWMMLSCLVSNMNDIFMKLLGTSINVAEIVFFRFLFSMLILLFIFKGRALQGIKIKQKSLHSIRIILGVSAIALACYSTTVLPLANVTAFSFSQPLFFLPIAVFFLREKLDYKRCFATIFGFIGVFILISPYQSTLNWLILIPILAAVLFAFMDLVTKKLIHQESYFTISLYFAIGTTVISCIPAILQWKFPNLKELFYLLLLGIGNNLIQLCIFMSFSAADVISLAPFRYVEIIFSVILGFFLFGELPSLNTYIGILLIILSILYMTYYQARNQRD